MSPQNKPATPLFTVSSHQSVFISAVSRELKSARQLVANTLLSLAERGEVDRSVVRDALDRYRLWDPTAADAGNTEGSG